jgi:hypothetical protein
MRADYVQDQSGDWCGLYVNGELADEGHSLDPWRVLTAIKEHQKGVAIKALYHHEVDLESLDLTRCPQRFIELWTPNEEK